VSFAVHVSVHLQMLPDSTGESIGMPDVTSRDIYLARAKLFEERAANSSESQDKEMWARLARQYRLLANAKPASEKSPASGKGE
jgi:hypothetical protein